MTTLWGVLWRSKNELDGICEHLMYSNRIPVIFTTRKEAREWIKSHYGYIKEREDLRAEPHGWKMPLPVQVKVEVAP